MMSLSAMVPSIRRKRMGGVPMATILEITTQLAQQISLRITLGEVGNFTVYLSQADYDTMQATQMSPRSIGPFHWFMAPLVPLKFIGHPVEVGVWTPP